MLGRNTNICLHNICEGQNQHLKAGEWPMSAETDMINERKACSQQSELSVPQITKPWNQSEGNDNQE